MRPCCHQVSSGQAKQASRPEHSLRPPLHLPIQATLFVSQPSRSSGCRSARAGQRVAAAQAASEMQRPADTRSSLQGAPPCRRLMRSEPFAAPRRRASWDPSGSAGRMRASYRSRFGDGAMLHPASSELARGCTSHPTLPQHEKRQSGCCPAVAARWVLALFNARRRFALRSGRLSA